MVRIIMLVEMVEHLVVLVVWDGLFKIQQFRAQTQILMDMVEMADVDKSVILGLS